MTASGPSSEPSRRGPSWTDLGPRVLSAIVLTAIIAVGLYFGGYVWSALAAAVFALTYREWERMVTLKPLAPMGVALIGVLAAAALVFPAFGPLGTVAVMTGGIVVALFGESAARPWRVGGLAFFGLVLVAVLGMRGTGTAGIVAGWYLGVVIASNDTGAFFVGRMIGGARLAPMISPAKTVSGAVGGWLIGTTAGSLFWWLFVSTSPLWIGILFSGAIGLAGQFGDLTESAVKRIFRVKDSGDMIPGHGGLMDRLDSVSFGILLLFVIGVSRGGFADVAGGFLYW